VTTENIPASSKPHAFLAAFGLALACLLSPVLAAAAGPLFVSSAALTTGTQDHATALARGPGGLYVVGYSSAGPQAKNIWVSRWNDANMTVISSMTLNGSANGDDAAQGVAIDTSGNVFVMGVSSVAGQGPSLWLGQFASNLAFISSATFPIANYTDPTAPKGLVLGPGGVTVFTEATVGGAIRILLAQFTPSLTFVSSATFFNGFTDNIALGAARDAGGNFYVAGGVPPAPATSSDIWLGKFNASLQFISSATVAGAGGNTDQARSVVLGPDGNVYVGGIINNAGVNVDAWIAKYSPSLALLGSASFPSPVPSSNAVIDHLVPAATRLYASGRVDEAGQGANAWVLEFDYNLALLSSASLTSSPSPSSFDEYWGLAVDTMSGAAFAAGYATPSGTAQILVARYQLPAVVDITPLGYTGVSAGGLTANWNTSLAFGTTFYLKISSNAFATINSVGSTINTNFVYSGLTPSLTYTVRVSTLISGTPFSSLGPVTLPAGGGGAINFNFSVNGPASIIGSANGQNEAGLNVVVDRISGGGPYTYVVFFSTPGATAARGFGHDTAGVVGLVRYGPGGNAISSRTLAIDSDGKMAVDNAGNVFVAEMDKSLGLNSRWISKYSPSLGLVGSVYVSSSAVGDFGSLASNGTSVYAQIEDRNDNTLKLVNYDANLVVLATAAPYSLSGNPMRAFGIAGDNLYGYVLVSSAAPNAPVHLLRYPTGALNGATPLPDVVVAGLTASQEPRLTATAGKVYVAFPSGTSVFVREFDTALNYTGVSSTITNVSGPFGKARVSIDSANNAVFVAATVANSDPGDYVVAKYDATNALAFVSSATYNSPTVLSDQAFGMAVGNSGEVYVTGASSDTIGNANAATVKFVLAGGGGSCGSPVISSGVVSGMSTSSMTFTWSPHPACPGGTVFTVQISSDSFATIISSLTTTVPFAAFTGLAQGTAYTVAVSTTGQVAGSPQIGPGTTFNSAALSISGSVIYPGFQPGAIKVEAFTNAASTGAPSAYQFLPSTGAFYLTVPANTYYLRAFVDVANNGSFQAWEDQGTFGASINVTASSATNKNFSITAESTAPATVVGVTASPTAGQIMVTWAVPTTNSDGTTLLDLRGFIVQRGTGAVFNNLGGSPSAPLSSATLTFTDFAPVPSVVNSYRVIAVDFGRNQSAPSATVSVAAGAAVAGGTISGHISSFTVTTSGTFRVRLSNTPNGAYIAESNQSYYSFSGLSSGTYYLKGFRDLDENGTQGTYEPAGTGGGLNNNPYPLFISGSNSPVMDVAVCDHSLLQVGSPVVATLLANGCPALDAGPDRYTNPLVFETGTGAAGSVSTGTLLAVSMTKINSGSALFDSRLVVVGPSGQIVASNSSPGGAQVSFTPVEFGVYLVEPTSSLQFSTGVYTVTMNAGASGSATEGIAGGVNYSGSQSGPIVVRFFDNSTFSGIPLTTFTVTAASGPVGPLPYDQRFLPAGIYTVDAYRDTAGTGYHSSFQAYGKCYSGSTVQVFAGSVTSGVDCSLSDPLTVNSGSSVISGTITYNGAQTGTVRIGLFEQYSDVPARTSSSAFAINTSYSFSAIAAGTYLVRAFIDANNNQVPDPNEAVITSADSGISVASASTRSGQDLVACDRTPILPGSPVTFSLSAACPSPDRNGAFMKMYTFYGTRSRPVTIAADAIGFSDSYLNLYDADGNLVDFDDDSGGSLNALIKNFTLPFDGVYTVAASPYYVNDVVGSIKLSVSESGGAVGSISGDVLYTGTQGGNVQVALFNSPSFSSTSYIDGRVLTSTRVYQFGGLFAGNTYYLGAFIDVNFNATPDSGEDKGVFGAGGVANPIFLQANQNVTGATILIAPSTTAAAGSAHLTGSVFYAGARTGQLILEFWPSAQFTGTPTAVRTIPTGVTASTATYDVTVPGGVNYFMRAFVDVNNDFVPNPDEPKGVYSPTGQGVEAVFAPQNQIVTNVNITLMDPGVSASGVIAGEGSASLIPATTTPGPLASLQVVYTAGPSGIGVGGRIGFSAPNGFPFPGPSSVVVTSTATVTFSTSSIGPSAFASVATGGVLAGQNIVFTWSNVYVPCAVGVQTVTVSAVQSAGAPAASLFGGSPALKIGAGAPFFFQPRNPYFSLAKDVLSEAQVLEARDSCGNTVSVVSASTVQLHSAMWSPAAGSFVADPAISLTADVGAATTPDLDLVFEAGVSSRSFYVVGASTGFHNLQMYFNLGNPSTYYYGLSVLPANALTGVNVSSSTTGQALSSATIGANALGVINPVFLNFSLGDSQQSWRVLFSSTPNRPDMAPTPVWERWGYGQPNPSEVVWDGRYSPWLNGGGRVPNGIYYGRVELAGGGVRNDTIRVTVALPQFAGRAYDSSTLPNPPLSGVQLRVYGPSGYYTATTGADGAYALTGLGAGNYRVNMARANYVDGALDMTLNASGAATSFIPRTPGVLVSSNAAGGLDLFISRSPRLIVVPSLDPSIAAVSSDQWGSLQVRPSTSVAQNGSTFYGPMRLKGGTTTFDDGGQWDPGTQQFVERTLLGFNLPVGTYTVLGDLSGYSRSTGTVYVGPEGARLDLTPFVPKAVVSGTVNLATPAPPGGLSVGIFAIALSTATGSSNLSGGAFINGGAITAPYSISGFDAGSYLLRANAQGFSATAPLTVVVVGTTAVTGQNFPNFGSGASITGTITATGAPDGSQIYINAWSPGSFNFGSTVVYTSAGAAPYALNGLDTGATYQLYANINGGGSNNNTQYDLTFPAGGFPIKVFPPSAAMNFTLAPASGVVSGLIILRAGASDFLNVTINGITLASPKPDEVGRAFTQISTSLPNFSCGGLPTSSPSSSPVAGFCPNSMSSATFLVTGENTNTLDIRFLHASSGQSTRQTLSIVNGSTVSFTADLRALTYSIDGSLIDQITDPLFNTSDKIVANAPLIGPLGYPAGLSSTTARVVAVRQEIDTYGTTISTAFNPVTSRVGFLVASGTFTIPNVPNGVYLVRTPDLRSCSTCAIVAPSVGRLVTVSNASLSNVTLTLSDGYSVAGTIQLDGGMQDAAVFDIRILNRRQEVVRTATAYLGDVGLNQSAGSVDYAFTNLPAGEFYTMVVKGRNLPVKYAGRPIKFPDPALSPTGLQSNLTHQDVLLQRAAYIIGRLKDNATGERIGALNAGLLAPNFAISATANPWVEGGYVTVASSMSNRPIEADGYFRVGPLVPDVSYDLRLAQATWDPNFLASGSQNYAPVTVSGIKPTSGEIRDVGTVGLGQGQSVTGVVRSTTTGLALGNIKVTARPSFGGDALVVQTFTNSAGSYSLWVSSLVSNQFNLTAAPRDGNQASDGNYYGTVVLSNVNLQTQTTADFLLTPLAAVVTGQLVVADAATGGALSYPFGDKRGFPSGAINLQPVGVVPNNPLGDIEAATDERGFFTVPGLSSGVYSLHATSLGYAVYNATVQVSGATFHIFLGSNTASNDLPGGVLTLLRGATATGRILKSDGSAPNSSEVVGVAAANFGSGEFVVGSVETDPVARTVNAYTISGFKPGVSYSIVLLSGSNGKEVSFPAEGAGVLFSAAESTTTKTINLTYRPAALDCLGTAKALDAARSRFQVKIDCLKPLRQETAADDDLTTILTLSTFTSLGAALAAPNGAGVLNNPSNSTNRRQLTAIYTLAPLETRFSMRIRASASEVDPRTGSNFAIDKVFDFYAGLDSSADGRATNINGGSVGLNPSAQDELLGLDERSRIDLPPGAFGEGADSLPDASVTAKATTTVNVSMTKGRDQQLAKALSIAAQGFAPAALSVADVPAAFPAEMWSAMSQYRTQASTTQVGGANPLSAFYSIFLPAGIRHQLKQRADLTLSYSLATSTGTADDKIQVWFYNATLGRFVLENTNRRLDPVNKTVTVSVDHFSTFVVLDTPPVLVVNGSFGGADIAVANFPNPSDCTVHSNIAKNSTLFGGGGVHNPFLGTMIRTSIPSGDAAELKFNIYTVAGEKIRTIANGVQTAGRTYYTNWDCKNDDGRVIASGVYIGEAIHGTRRKFFKIAIIKGSGL
jgi:hypothetical protein